MRTPTARRCKCKCFKRQRVTKIPRLLWQNVFHATFACASRVLEMFANNGAAYVICDTARQIRILILDMIKFTNKRHRFSAFWLRSKCSICSYQLNIWYVPHVGTSILNWFLQLGEMSGACTALATSWPGIAVLPGSAHSPLWGENKNQIKF